MTWILLATLTLVSFLLWRHESLYLPLAWLVILLIGDLLAFFFARFGIGPFWVRYAFLLGAVLAGFMALMQTQGKYQIYILKWGPRPLHRESYQALAECIHRYLWLNDLPPASVAMDPSGRLTFDQASSPNAQELMLECEECLGEPEQHRIRQGYQGFIAIHFLVVGLLLWAA